MSTPDPLEGMAIGERYRLGTRLGSGGMATVYRGEHLSLSKPVAIKVLSEALASDPDMAKRFEREAALAARLDHPHCVAVTDFGRLPSGQPFLVMDLVEGEPLDVIVRRGRLPWQRAVDLMRQILRGLARAHDLGVVHRDLKPSNVLVAKLAERDHARLIDFGIAKAWDGSAAGPNVQTEAGMVFGTPDFIAPERLAGKSETDPRSDLYAATVVFYELLTGVRPFADPDPVVTARRTLVEKPRSPTTALQEREPGESLPPPIDELVLRGLTKDPDHRFPSARAYLTELDALGPRLGPHAAIPVADQGASGPSLGKASQASPPLAGAPAVPTRAISSLTSLAATSLAGAASAEPPRGVLTEALSHMAPPSSAASSPVTDQLAIPPRRPTMVWVGVGAIGVLLMIVLISLALTTKKGKPGQGGLAMPLGMGKAPDSGPTARKDGQGEIAQLIARAQAPSSVDDRAEAADRLVVLGYDDKIPWRAKLEQDLVQESPCEDRLEVVQKLAKLEDRKAIPALERARARSGNDCLRSGAAQAIVELGGEVSDGPTKSRPGDDEAPPRRKRSGEGGGGHF